MDYNRIVRPSTKVFAIVFAALYAVSFVLWWLDQSLVAGILVSAMLVIPPAILAWFILSLVLFIRAKKRGDDDLPALKHRMKTAVILLIFLAIMIALLFAFFACAISHM